MATRRKATRVRWAVRIGLSLIAGAVSTVLVAWWFGSEPTRLIPVPSAWSMSSTSTGFRLMEKQEEGRARCWFLDYGPGSASLVVWNRPMDDVHEESRTMLESAPTAALPSWSRAGDLIDTHQLITEERAGWPLRCMHKSGVQPIGSESLSGYTLMNFFWMPSSLYNLLQPQDPELSKGILPIGFAVNTLLYGTAWLIIRLSLSAVCRRVLGQIRQRANRCPACGYSLEGMTADACPECGRAMKSQSHQ